VTTFHFDLLSAWVGVDPMQLRSLRVFCDVVAKRSFSRAANELGITQSGASQVVHQLERRLKVKLIDRSKRPFVLTDEGRVYYEGCRQIVRRYDELEGELRTLRGEVAGRVVVASIYSVGLYQMDEHVKEFLALHPRANVRLEYQHPHRVYEMIEGDQADLGLVSYPRASRKVRAIDWLAEPMVLVCAERDPLARRTSVALSELDGLSMVSFTEELKIRRHIDKALAAQRAEVKVAMELDNIETIKRAVEIGAGVSLLPEVTVRREVAAGTLAAVPLAGEPLLRPLGIIHRRGKPLGAAARRLVQLLRDRAARGGCSDPSGTTGPALEESAALPRGRAAEARPCAADA
jgi:DNA-binding transcriptional LysR family regulator